MPLSLHVTVAGDQSSSLGLQVKFTLNGLNILNVHPSYLFVGSTSGFNHINQGRFLFDYMASMYAETVWD
jgi:hypothetical protein